MTLKTFVSITLMASLLLAAAPIPVRAADGPTATTNLRASIDRAVAEAVAAQKAVPAAQAVRTQARAAAAGQMGGGGGGKSMMVMMLIGTIAGLAGTYFLVKELRKKSDTQTGQ